MTGTRIIYTAAAIFTITACTNVTERTQAGVQGCEQKRPTPTSYSSKDNHNIDKAGVSEHQTSRNHIDELKNMSKKNDRGGVRIIVKNIVSEYSRKITEAMAKENLWDVRAEIGQLLRDIVGCQDISQASKTYILTTFMQEAPTTLLCLMLENVSYGQEKHGYENHVLKTCMVTMSQEDQRRLVLDRIVGDREALRYIRHLYQYTIGFMSSIPCVAEITTLPDKDKREAHEKMVNGILEYKDLLLARLIKYNECRCCADDTSSIFCVELLKQASYLQLSRDQVERLCGFIFENMEKIVGQSQNSCSCHNPGAGPEAEMAIACKWALIHCPQYLDKVVAWLKKHPKVYEGVISRIYSNLELEYGELERHQPWSRDLMRRNLPVLAKVADRCCGLADEISRESILLLVKMCSGTMSEESLAAYLRSLDERADCSGVCDLGSALDAVKTSSDAEVLLYRPHLYGHKSQIRIADVIFGGLFDMKVDLSDVRVISIMSSGKIGRYFKYRLMQHALRDRVLDKAYKDLLVGVVMGV